MLLKPVLCPLSTPAATFPAATLPGGAPANAAPSSKAFAETKIVLQIR